MRAAHRRGHAGEQRQSYCAVIINELNNEIASQYLILRVFLTAFQCIHAAYSQEFFKGAQIQKVILTATPARKVSK